jgi:hypothetical protein
VSLSGSGDLAARESAVAWDLRAAWGTGARVSVRFEDGCVVERIQGRVTHVSATGATATVDDGHADGPMDFPCVLVLSVRKPHFHEPLDARPDAAPAIAPEFGSQLSLLEMPGT